MTAITLSYSHVISFLHTTDSIPFAVSYAFNTVSAGYDKNTSLLGFLLEDTGLFGHLHAIKHVLSDMDIDI